MSELHDKDSINVEQIMGEIRANISSRARVEESGKSIRTLEEARAEAARRIEEREYIDDLPPFEGADLHEKIEEIKVKGTLGPNVPIEGNFLKRFIKRIIRRVIRCVTGPLTGQITETNMLTVQCLEQAVSLLEQQQKQINDLSMQLAAVRESLNKETISE